MDIIDSKLYEYECDYREGEDKDFFDYSLSDPLFWDNYVDYDVTK